VAGGALLACEGTTAAKNQESGKEQHPHEQRESRRCHGGNAIRIDGGELQADMAAHDARVQGLDADAPHTLAFAVSQHDKKLVT